MSDRALQAMRYYISRGWAPHQAAAIVGNLQEESGFNTTIKGDKGTAIGLAQWRGDRRRGLMRFANSMGKPWDDFEVQLAYVDHELNTTEAASGHRLRTAGNIDDATAAMIGYERPRGWTKNNPRGGHNWKGRLRSANKFAQLNSQMPGTQAMIPDPVSVPSPVTEPEMPPIPDPTRGNPQLMKADMLPFSQPSEQAPVPPAAPVEVASAAPPIEQPAPTPTEIITPTAAPPVAGAAPQASFDVFGNPVMGPTNYNFAGRDFTNFNPNAPAAPPPNQQGAGGGIMPFLQQLFSGL